MKYRNIFILTALIQVSLWFSCMNMQLEAFNQLFEKYSRIGELIQAFYKQPFDKEEITKEEIRLAYNNFIKSLNEKDLEQVAKWDKSRRIAKPKWLIED